MESRYHIPWYTYAGPPLAAALLVGHMYAVGATSLAVGTGVVFAVGLWLLLRRYAFLSRDGYLCVTDTHFVLHDKPGVPVSIPLTEIAEVWWHGGRAQGIPNAMPEYLSVCYVAEARERWRHVRTFGIEYPPFVVSSLVQAAGLEKHPVPLMCPYRYRRPDHA